MSPTITQESLYLGINAGGFSRRWGGGDKALAPYQGKRLIDAVLDGLTHYPLLGVCIRAAQQDDWLESGYPLCIESAPDGFTEGPLCGIHALLRVLAERQGEWLLLLACDMPNISAEVVDAMLATQKAHQARCVSLRDAQGRDAMVALIHVSCLPNLTHFLAQGGCRYRDGLLAMDAVACLWQGDSRVLLNLNSPQPED